MKTGYQTTEFWISVFAVIVGAVISSGILEQTSTGVDNQIFGVIATILGGLGYTASRSFVKAATIKADTLKAVGTANPT